MFSDDQGRKIKGKMSGYFFDSRDKQSYPVFWILGSLGGVGFTLLGGFLIYSFLNTISSERDNGMLYTGIFFAILGVLLLAGVIYTLFPLPKKQKSVKEKEER